MKRKNKNKTLGEAVVVGAAITGAAIGAAAVILSDKKNQKKIQKTVDEISHDAVKLGKNIKKRAEEFKKTVQDKKNAKLVVKETLKKASSKTTPTQ